MTLQQRQLSALLHQMPRDERDEVLRIAATAPRAPRDSTTDYAPPDPYRADLERLRAARATDRSKFEEAWKASRRAELAVEYARLDAEPHMHPTSRLTAAELAKYTPPDPYAESLKALRAKEGKR